MFHVTYHGSEVRCESADEVRSLLNGTAAPKPAQAAGTTTDGTTNQTTEGKKELPLVRGKLTWDKVKEVGKDVERTDYKTLRSELKVIQDAAKK